MSARTHIAEGVRAWLLAAAVTATIIYAHQDGPRPALPYLVVTVRLTDLPVGGDAIHHRSDDTVVGVGERRSAVTVHAFGELAAEQLEEAVSRLPLDASQVVLVDAGLTVEPSGGLLDLTGVVDGHHETRTSRDFDVAYQRVSGGEAFVEAATVRATHEVDDLTTTYDVS